MFNRSMPRCSALVFTLIALALLPLTHASASDLPDTAIEAFRGDTPDSKVTVDYKDLSAILNQTVWETGQSDRITAGTTPPRTGSRITTGARGNTRLEGNRIDFHAFLGDNYDVMVALRRDLEKVPSVVPLNQFNRNEQLAYWLNLYNLTVITQIAGIFPETNLKKHYPVLWEEKVLTVASVPLSLNDIHHKILIPKYRDPLIMYGLFQGVIGGPNIRDEAYTGVSVWSQLKANAREFVNSNRGAFVRERIIRTSTFYEVNKALFPNFEVDMKAHLMRYAKKPFADKLLAASSRVGTDQRNWYVADLFGGNRSRSSASSNPAALLNAFTNSGEGYSFDGGGEFSGEAAVASAWGNTAITHNQSLTRFPIHMVNMVRKIQTKNQRHREGNVEVEEYDDAPDEGEAKDNPDK